MPYVRVLLCRASRSVLPDNTQGSAFHRGPLSGAPEYPARLSCWRGPLAPASARPLRASPAAARSQSSQRVPPRLRCVRPPQYAGEPRVSLEYGSARNAPCPGRRMQPKHATEDCRDHVCRPRWSRRPQVDGLERAAGVRLRLGRSRGGASRAGRPGPVSRIAIRPQGRSRSQSQRGYRRDDFYRGTPTLSGIISFRAATRLLKLTSGDHPAETPLSRPLLLESSSSSATQSDLQDCGVRFVRSSLDFPIIVAWETFGEANGCGSLDSDQIYS